MQKGFLGEISASEEDLALINRFSKKKLTADEVYIFSVVLCDNDIDRDFEQFTPETLKKFETLFVGKTGIFDHSMKGRDQIARTFSCSLEETGELNSIGEPYIRLTAKAYMPRTPETEELINRLEAGILKEVSVGCSVAKEICSICGADRRRDFCGHKKGEFYGEGLKKLQCHSKLQDPTDAYEWSFVAVPSQRRAGVIKAFSPQEEGVENLNVKDIIKSLGESEITLSSAEAQALKTEFEGMQAVMKSYIHELRCRVVKNCGEALPELSGEMLDSILKVLSPEQLKAFGKALEKKQPLAPQTACGETREQSENKEFVI